MMDTVILPQGILVIVSGPSGVGKSTLCKKIVDILPGTIYSISVTTRALRGDEVHGREYFFSTRKEFEKKILRKEFLEWAIVYENYYGTLRDFVDNNLNAGYDVILDIDVWGGMQVKYQRPESISIFIYPPSLERLTAQLKSRAKDDGTEITNRLTRVKEELWWAKKYDYLVINDNLEVTLNEVKSIFIAERKRTKRIIQLPV